MELRRVVVTGLGALTPIGNTVEEYWNGLVSGTSGAAAITRFYAEKFKTQFACEIKNFDPTQYLDRKEARKMDPTTQIGMIVSDEAMLDSGINLDKIDKSRAGVIWGSGIGGLRTFHDEVAYFASGDGTPKFNPFFYSQDDRGYHRRADIYEIWSARTQLCYCISMRIIYKRPK